MHKDFVIKRNIFSDLLMFLMVIFVPVLFLTFTLMLWSDGKVLLAALWSCMGILLSISQFVLVREYFIKGFINTKEYNKKTFLEKLGFR